MQVEEQRARQLAHVLEAPLGALAVGLGNTRLAQSDHGPDHEPQHGDRRRGDAQPVPKHELGRPIAQRIGARQERTSFQVAPEVVGQLERGGVPPRRLLLQALQHDGVQVAGRAGAASRVTAASATAALGRGGLDLRTTDADDLLQRAGHERVGPAAR